MSTDIAGIVDVQSELGRSQRRHSSLCPDEAFFYLNYQLLRNVAHLDLARGDQLRLVLPRANALTWMEGEKFLDHLEPAARDAVQLVAMEDLVTALRSGDAGTSSQMEAHLDVLCEKYAFSAKAAG